MGTLFDWFKITSKEPDKPEPDKKATDHTNSATKKQNNFSKAILKLMKEKKEITNGYYLKPKVEPKLDPETNPSPNKKPDL
jgi:hypothetical protein